jgi:PEP-CTERM motif
VSTHSISRSLWPRLACAALLLAATGSHAAVSLFNTGVNNAGATLSTGAIDTHFVLVTASGTAPTYAVDDAYGYTGYWMGPSSTSKWVTSLVTGGEAGDVPAANYIYQTTFDLTGFNVATASLQGRMAADNEITGVQLNGANTGLTAYGYDSFAPFSISGGFVPGINTLQFIVNNSGGPSGLRAELLGDFTAAVPEPGSSLLMLGGVMVLMGTVTWRRRRITSL